MSKIITAHCHGQALFVIDRFLTNRKASVSFLDHLVAETRTRNMTFRPLRPSSRTRSCHFKRLVHLRLIAVLCC